MMISGQFDAVIPMLCVTLAGLVVLLAEAFRGRGEKMPIGGLAIIGLVGAGAASILLWDSGAETASASSPPTTSGCSSISCWSWSAC